jgi:hypothetical protein
MLIPTNLQMLINLQMLFTLQMLKTLQMLFTLQMLINLQMLIPTNAYTYKCFINCIWLIVSIKNKTSNTVNNF